MVGKQNEIDRKSNYYLLLKLATLLPARGYGKKRPSDALTFPQPQSLVRSFPQILWPQ